jgi:hypothetical protein
MTGMKLNTLCFAILLSLWSLDASAQQVAAESGPAYERGGMLNTGLVLGLKAGGGFSQPFGDLGASFLAELEVGYVLPFMDRSFEVFLGGAYTQPKADGKQTDARLGGAATYELTQQQGIFTLGILYRLHLSSDLIRPYGALGPRVYAMRTKANGKASGEAFGENEETVTKIGAYAGLGVELHFGPGAVLLEASLGWAKIDGYVLRDTSAGAIGLSLGYRLFL